MKTATLLIYEPHQANSVCVAVIYRRNQLMDFVGQRGELQTLTEKAINFMANCNFTRVKVNGKIYEFKDFLMKGQQ